MAAADVSAIVDFASSVDPTPAPDPVISEPEISTPDSPAPETPEVDAAATPDSPEPGGEPAPEPGIDGRTNPPAIRAALKAFRDSDPKNAPIARELNDSYGRWQAAKEVFPGGVAEMRNVKAFIDANGGVEGLTALHETVKSVGDTDALLYAGDPRVLDSIIEDMRAEGKLDAFSKLAGPYLDKLRATDEKGYFNTLKPHFYQGLVGTGAAGLFANLAKVLGGDKPDVEAARGIASELNRWISEMRDSVELADRSKLDPDRQAFEKERTDFQTQKQTEFRNGIASTADSYSNEALGKALAPFRKLPFIANLFNSDKAKISLAREIKGSLLEELSLDKTYQAQMSAFLAAKSPDKARIQQYHQAKVDTMAKRIVKQVIETRYPDYAKRVAVTPKPGAAKPAAPTAPQSGQPEYVKEKPAWESIDWERDPGKMLFVTSKAYLKSGKFVYWGKQKK